MGMFDDIICKYKLPMPKNPKGYSGSERFQTKDLENCLSLYKIQEDGTIWLETYERKIIDGNPKGKSIFDRIGRFQKINVSWKQLFDTDTINIYDYEESTGDYDYYILYKLVFKEGVVSSVDLLEFEASDNSKRKKREKEFEKELKERAKFVATLRYRVLYRHWNKLVSFVFRNLQKTTQKIGCNLLKVESFLKI